VRAQEDQMGRVLALSLILTTALVAGPSAPAEAFDARADVTKAPAAVAVTLPMKENSVRFAVIGDTGSGAEVQHDLAEIMVRYRAAFPYQFVLMLGDNLYGGETPAEYQSKFEDVYKPLLNEKVKFYASLGNHDKPNQRFYENFNMNGKEYFKFEEGNASFYSLNTNYMDEKQVKWLEDELAKDRSDWKIAFFHHPPYSSGKQHGSNTEVREVLEPIFLKHGVNLVLAGHEHFYERIKPQKGIYYFISGAGGKLRPDGIKRSSPLTEVAYDEDLHFMAMEVAGDELHFQVVSRAGKTIDSGVLRHQRKPAETAETK
jgi:hypothetical protein